ncbi:MAG: bifunctional glycosyltransferase/class I SAM-dependent methyltransferase [Acidobacteria bacterium]|nr:bifunctional glycosyltransferase/class I SAM-dependent methyltransferase [Acidobacteriota bacterium]
MKLSILIPVYNERTVVEQSLKLVLAAPLPESLARELIIVDDCSRDGTWDILQRIAATEPRIKLYRHEVNQGKGAAIRTAIGYATGDFSLIQDADLEYDPNEYPVLMAPLLSGNADAVFGSRYMAGEQRRVLPFWHTKINEALTTLSNIFSNLSLTDMETCYKAFRTDLLKSIPIRSNRFGIEPELAMKCAKRRLRIYEVPISYHGRTYEEGKKIGWKDGVNALGVILKFWLIDDLYSQPYGRAFLNNMSGTPQYLNWIAGLLRPYIGDRVLEIGAGIGNLTGLMMGRRVMYVAAEKDPLYLHALRNRFLRTPNVRVETADAGSAEDIRGLPAGFDTALCLNVLEYLEDPAATLAALRDSLADGGRLLVLVPQGKRLFGTIDETLGHRRRFSRAELEKLLTDAGFSVEVLLSLNRAGAPAWWLFGQVLGRRQINKMTLKLFDKGVWLWRRIDGLLPWPGVSLVAVARKQA